MLSEVTPSIRHNFQFSIKRPIKTFEATFAVTNGGYSGKQVGSGDTPTTLSKTKPLQTTKSCGHPFTRTHTEAWARMRRYENQEQDLIFYCRRTTPIATIAFLLLCWEQQQLTDSKLEKIHDWQRKSSMTLKVTRSPCCFLGAEDKQLAEYWEREIAFLKYLESSLWCAPP